MKLDDFFKSVLLITKFQPCRFSENTNKEEQQTHSIFRFNVGEFYKYVNIFPHEYLSAEPLRLKSY